MGKIIYAWCKKIMRDGVANFSGASHGICPQCETKMKKQIEEMKRAKARKGKERE